MVRRPTRTVVVGLAAIMVFWFACIQMAYATPPDNRPPDNRPPDSRPPTGEVNVQVTNENLSQSQAEANAQAGAEATAQTTVTTTAQGGDGGDGGAGGAGGTGYGGEATASNEGVSAEFNDNSSYENNNTNVVLVPNNNTAGCMRVWGVSFGNHEGAAALGMPFRDGACDYEAAADDAAAIGQHEIAWYWRCHKRNLYKTFGGAKADSKILACFDKMKDMLAIQGSDEPVPTGHVIIEEEEYELLMAQAVQKEELEEFAEQQEQRYAQQQNLLDALQAEHESDEDELARLKRKAAELAAAQEARKVAEKEAQQKFKERLAAKEEK